LSIAGERPVDGGGDVRRDPGRQGGERDGRVAHDPTDDGEHVLLGEAVRGEGVDAADQLHEHGAEGEEIAAAVDVRALGELLGRHVGAVPRVRSAVVTRRDSWNLPEPRSSTRTMPSLPRWMLSGLTSRWTAWGWTAVSPSATARPAASAQGSGILPR